MPTLSVKSFTGSLTDFPIGADPSQYEMADNLVIDQYEKLISRPGRQLEFTTSVARAQVATSAGTKRISLMCAQTTGTSAAFTILKVVGQTIQYDNGTAMTELVGPSGASAFGITGGIDAETAFSFAEWNDHTIITHDEPFQKPVKVYRDGSGNLKLRTAGLPNIANTFTATGGSGANYVYAIFTKYEYTVGEVTYDDFGPVTLKEFTNIGSATPGSSPGITVGSIPVITNATGEHYDTAVITKEIYRTTNAGVVLYKVASIANATTSYSDTTSDTALVLLESIYTEGGVVSNDRPPKCRYVHGTSDFVFYGYGIEVSSTGADIDVLPQRVWQSKRGDPDGVPASFFADMEEPITGISSVRSIPVIFCENSIYRLDGNFDDLGRGGIIPKKISDSVGAVNHLSLVQTLEGVFFAGTDGFYFTDGYAVTPLSDLFRTSYAKLVNTNLKRLRIYGALDLSEQRVLWATWKSNGEPFDDDNAQLYCLDLRKKAFTTWGSGFSGSIETTLTGTNVGAAVTFSDTTGLEAGFLTYRNSPTASLRYGSFIDVVASSTVVNLNYAATNQSALGYSFTTNDPANAFFRNFLPTALLFANRTLFMGDVYGYTTTLDKTVPEDVWLDPSGVTLPTALEVLPIYFYYKGAFFDFGSTEVRKYVHTILTKARPRLDINARMTLQITGENDDNDLPHELTYIKFEQFYPWGTTALAYGDPRLYQTRRTIIDVKRRFPARKLRCEYKQVGMAPAFVGIYQSSVYANANVTAGASANLFTCTLATSAWPTDVFNYWIAFVTDDYTAEFRIVQRISNSVIQIHDPTGLLSTGTNRQWVIRGLLKDALIDLIEYSLFFEFLGPSQQPYQNDNAVVQ